MGIRQATAPRTSPPDWTPRPPGTVHKRGARPSPLHKLMAATPFVPSGTTPAQFGRVPGRLSFWDNNVDGDCVSAEEACKCAANDPEIFIPDAEVVSWARAGGFLNGADLSEVMDAMARKGFVIGSQEYRDGPHQTVDFSTESILQAALYQGPVKIAIDSSTLPSGAGNEQGWVATSCQGRGSDHCVGLLAYGTAVYLFGLLGVPLPSSLPPTQNGYLLFTWSTIGFVTHQWIMGTTTEAHVRMPSTVGIPPLPDPTVDWNPTAAA